MHGELFDMPNGPELQDYLVAWQRAIEKLLALADQTAATDPVRAADFRAIAKTEALRLMEVREWLDLH